MILHMSLKKDLMRLCRKEIIDMTDKDFLPKSFGIGNFQIAFYALFILLGALLALFLSKRHMKKLGYDPKDLDNVFLVAFPMGLVGARVWYCVFQAHEFQRANFFLSILACLGFENGKFTGLSGLAIQGGVLFGVVAGVLFVHKYRRHMKLSHCADVIVPTILLAQAIGRIGNFFNREVYGLCVDSSMWSWLGSWFVKQMSYDGVTNALICENPAQMAMPLCLIEALINIAGYFILTQLVHRFTSKKGLNWVTTFSYFIWYGLVRLFLEPLRNPKFIMEVEGSGIPTSRLTAVLFIIIGVLLVAAVIVNKYILEPKNKDITTLVSKYSTWFDSLPRNIRIILEAIPVTGYINSILYRISKDNFTCGVLCIFVGPIFWIIDLVTTIWKDELIVFAKGPKLDLATSPNTPKEEIKEEKEETKDE